MSRLNNLYQSAKRHTGKIVAGALIVGALAGMRGCAKNMGEEVYRGNINGQEVVYEEGLSSFRVGTAPTQNKMVVREGDTTYTFLDRIGDTNIDWKDDEEPNFKKDELEGIIVDDGNIREFYHIGDMKDWNPTTIDGRRKKEIFEKGNEMYNDLRTQIREQLRAQYEAQPNPLE